ncbi:16S rRNA (cytosine(1402)-N(4))-methyltransferase RsmH [Phaeobacter gallaeciensis]|jgi:16S rRNA (cytosine1402-N4)-methyltransferase|uniref:16S rRNA (cytosine(1402)-N(4))-methyltransferase RsmH n=1 Tax=Rhodobacterales TaxID=204455 RepID=UPI00237F6689|nr:16S rRNA (cytosine(1402)-N(4))-methyltransferase RsmH [Phaeobacter gallaeciensis]MEC9312250.1 16S rRNA (cytosine(1402)-N(4))-methyltransferase RsmH [Pseudomonadota bacterium]MDE4095856.1 16S rRNA (cytosine(1402)-N(4))-methyltransferase RsmH [Phaeobacter gallaeciensis]MDE4104667.1 16S rRNA (cytosine(1402)-N(4))-methyltransferase RsmH [Phaeobacter gallaeciensis]MDE4109124.1 16S rRNA (cytosine(1402)-N(4))-methyltransferase RsmH [Phaeobacter gallaeciensis]MDE4113591.1 16S rRNA (cytosine(1402)-N
MTTEHTSASGPHIPVLLRPLLKAVAPVTGRWLDGTFGAGGYTRALLEAGADQVIAVDRDPLAFEMAKSWAGEYGDRLVQQQGVFSRMDEYAQDLDGVVLDLGVSSMQLDLAERGFSFMKDGPLDMRMSQEGPSAADLVAELSEAELADILFYYGEERASRRIARAIVKAREVEPITTTLQLASLVESCLPRAKPGQSHPATRSFQALRIAVNAEYDELFEGLLAAERALKPGGLLAVVTFHSVEDRMVKRFFQHRAGKTGRANRYAPEIEEQPAQFEIVTRKAVGPDDQELAENPRSRSARLRVGRRTDAAPAPISARDLGMPQLKEARK